MDIALKFTSASKQQRHQDRQRDLEVRSGLEKRK